MCVPTVYMYIHHYVHPNIHMQVSKKKSGGEGARVSLSTAAESSALVPGGQVGEEEGDAQAGAELAVDQEEESGAAGREGGEKG